MKALSTVSLFIIVFTFFSSKANADNIITFKAVDERIATKLCVAAVSNDLQKTKRYIKSLSWVIYGGMHQKTKFVIDDIFCNDTDLVKFTAQYNAKETFEYLNVRAMKRYRLDANAIKVIELARQSSMKNTPQVIAITSR